MTAYRLAVCLVASSVLIGCADDTRPAGPRQHDGDGGAIDGGGSAVDGGAVDGGGSDIDGGPTCGTGLTACGESCVDTSSDVANCGSCGSACGAGQVCSGSACLTGGCPGGTTDCSGSCVDTQVSTAHCGGCGMACPAGTTCVAGECACGGGLTLCDGACVDTDTDAASCGSCGNACGAGQECAGGSCVACGTGITYAQVQAIFDASCTTGCHGGRAPSAGLDLTRTASYGALVNVESTCLDGRPLVAPGNAEGSLLYQKVADTGGCGGSRMPLGRPALSADRIAIIRGWICGGAEP